MVINMKYIIGSLIISFGVLFVAVIVLRSLHVEAPDHIMNYLGLAWALLAIVTYPIAKKLFALNEIATYLKNLRSLQLKSVVARR